jgi:hypothetical protein
MTKRFKKCPTDSGAALSKMRRQMYAEGGWVAAEAALPGVPFHPIELISAADIVVPLLAATAKRAREPRVKTAKAEKECEK